MNNEKIKANHSMPSNMMFFIKLMFKASPLLVIGEMIWGILLNLPNRLISVLGVKYIIDVMLSGERQYRIFVAVGIIAAVIIISRLLCWLFREFFWNTEREKCYYALNKGLYEKAKALDLESYDNPNFYNDFILTIESSSDNIQNLLGLVRNYFGNVVALITVSSILLTIDPWCLVIILAVIAVFMPLSKKIGNLQMQRQIENTKYHRRSDYFQRIFYLQDYAKEVRMNNIHPLLIDRYKDAADDVIKNQDKYWTKISRLYCVQEMGVQVFGFMLALPLYLGYLVMVKKTIGAGDFVATFNGAYSIAMSINFLTVWAIARFEERAKMIEKYRGFLAADFKIADGAKEAPKTEPKEIKIENLSFTYPGNSKPTLNNINLTVKPYEKIALVGYNGAGKTTLTNLLLRLYDAGDGSIKIDGEDIRDVSVSSHRDRFAAVFQDFQTFACTVGENVALSDEVDKHGVETALKHSGFTKELKHGVDTELLREFDDEGIMLSGGESQKVAVARAFYKDCPYVILDEPSANLDPVAEYNLNQAMLEAAHNKTVIFISHRLSTTVNADKIYVMENGQIIESGSHSELMEKNGTYAYMFNLQAEKYKNGVIAKEA
ncbi:MAG: ABC transporter ATP-binding protein [Eubacterium sp.]